MFDPITIWSRMTSAAMAAGNIASRTNTAHDAARMEVTKPTLRLPLSGDYVELSQMVPKQIDALVKAGAAASGEWWSIQLAFLTQAQCLGEMIMRGRPPTFDQLSSLSTRNTAYALQTMDHLLALAGNALAPVDRRVPSTNYNRGGDGNSA